MDIVQDTVFFFYQSTFYYDDKIFLYIEATKEKANGEIEWFERKEKGADVNSFNHKGLTVQDFNDFENFLNGCKLITYDQRLTKEIFEEIASITSFSFDGDIEDLLKLVRSNYKIKDKNQLIALGDRFNLFGKFKPMAPSEMLRKIYKVL